MKAKEQILSAGTYTFRIYGDCRKQIEGYTADQQLPVIGSDTIEHEISFAGIGDASYLLRVGKAVTLEYRSAQEGIEMCKNDIRFTSLRITERAIVKEIKLGHLRRRYPYPGIAVADEDFRKDAWAAIYNPMDIAVKLETTNLIVTYDGEEMLYIDKANGRYRVNGIEQNPPKTKLL